MNMPLNSRPRTGVIVADAAELDSRLTAIEELLKAILEAKAEPKPVLLDRSGLAVALNLSTKSLDKLRDEPGFPELRLLDSPRFELPAVLDWLRTRDLGLRLVSAG
jgi:hypothetical protein